MVSDSGKEPIWLISELNDEGYETRRIEIFRDGRRTYQNAEQIYESALDVYPVLELEGIQKMTEFQATRFPRQSLNRRGMSNSNQIPDEHSVKSGHNFSDLFAFPSRNVRLCSSPENAWDWRRRK